LPAVLFNGGEAAKRRGGKEFPRSSQRRLLINAVQLQVVVMEGPHRDTFTRLAVLNDAHGLIGVLACKEFSPSKLLWWASAKVA
jgi:hypothetical protein